MFHHTIEENVLHAYGKGNPLIEFLDPDDQRGHSEGLDGFLNLALRLVRILGLDVERDVIDVDSAISAIGANKNDEIAHWVSFLDTSIL